MNWPRSVAAQAAATAYVLLGLMVPKLVGAERNNMPTVLQKARVWRCFWRCFWAFFGWCWMMESWRIYGAGCLDPCGVGECWFKRDRTYRKLPKSTTIVSVPMSWSMLLAECLHPKNPGYNQNNLSFFGPGTGGVPRCPRIQQDVERNITQGKSVFFGFLQS